MKLFPVWLEHKLLHGNSFLFDLVHSHVPTTWKFRFRKQQKHHRNPQLVCSPEDNFHCNFGKHSSSRCSMHLPTVKHSHLKKEKRSFVIHYYRVFQFSKTVHPTRSPLQNNKLFTYPWRWPIGWDMVGSCVAIYILLVSVIFVSFPPARCSSSRMPS